MTPETDKAIIIFDGVCNFCNRFVNFVIDHDPNQHFQFVAGQSSTGEALLAKFSLPISVETIVLVQSSQCDTHSTAVLKILGQLSGGFAVLYYLIVVPRSWRDGVYRFVAKHRYRWMGKSDACRIPSPELKQRFLP